MEVECRECGLVFDVDDDRRGERVRCPECGERTDARPARRRRDRDDAPGPSTGQTLGIVFAVVAGLVLLTGVVCGGVIWYVSNAVGRAADKVAGMAEEFRKKAEEAARKARAQPIVTDEQALEALNDDDDVRKVQGMTFLEGRNPPADPQLRQDLIEALEDLTEGEPPHIMAQAKRLLVRYRGR